MPPKPETEQHLQAVVIADQFNPAFAVLDTPWAATPLAGYTLLDYTLEFVSGTPFQELIVACDSAEETLIQKLLSRWERRFSSIEIVSCAECEGVGHAMREVDSRDLIKGDFLLVKCGAICNDDLTAALAEHRARRRKDKDAVLTLLHAWSSPGGHPMTSTICPTTPRPVLVIDGGQQLTHYGDVVGPRSMDAEIAITTKMCAGGDGLETRTNLIDFGVALCSNQIPSLFTDNFDFQTLNTVIKEILVNQEISGQKIHSHILNEKCFAALVTDYDTLLTVNRLLLQRWGFPICPDGFLTQIFKRYSCANRFVYATTQSKSSQNVCSTLISPEVMVADELNSKNATIGKRTKIASKCKLQNCLIFDDVVVGPGCQLKQCVLASGVKLGHSCTVGERVVIGPGVVLPPETAVRSGSVLAKSKPPSEMGHLDSEEFCPGVFRWFPKHPQDDPWPEMKRTEGFGTIVLMSGHETVTAGPSTSASGVSAHSADRKDSISKAVLPKLSEDLQEFYEEVLATLKRGLDNKKLECKNLILEVNRAKFAYNVMLKDVNRLVARSIFELTRRKVVESGGEYWDHLKQICERLKPLLQNYLTSIELQLRFLGEVELHCPSTELNVGLGGCLVRALKWWFDEELLTEAAILSWHEQLGDDDTDNNEQFDRNRAEIIRAKMAPLVAWLEEADDESDTSGGEDED